MFHLPIQASLQPTLPSGLQLSLIHIYNFVSDTIADSRFNEYFGFTQKEVDQILEDAEITELAPVIKSWYDGYHFGNFDVYCPWDVMNYLRDLQYDPQIQPRSYWKTVSYTHLKAESPSFL